MFNLMDKPLGDKVGEILFGCLVLFGIWLVIMLIAKKIHETAKCPNCMSPIDKSAKVCKHCGRDVPLDKETKFSNGQLARLSVGTSGWPSSIKIKSSSRQNTTYSVNLSEQTCQCPNFVDERGKFKYGDPRRFCKHMAKALIQNSSGKKIPPAVYKLFSDANHAEKGVYFDEYKIVTCGGRDIIISKSHDTQWYSAIIPENKGATRYSYNPVEMRWAYKRSPDDRGMIIGLIERWQGDLEA